MSEQERYHLERIDRLIKINTKQAGAIQEIKRILLPYENCGDPFDDRLDRITAIIDNYSKQE